VIKLEMSVDRESREGFTFWTNAIYIERDRPDQRIYRWYRYQPWLDRRAALWFARLCEV